MRARQLEVFRTVMRAGTVTGAAKALNVSQPALSQILLHTEDELGFRLFHRIKGRLVPTPEAEELFPEADRLFDDLDNLRSLALDLKHGKVGTVRLAASAPPSLSFVPRALRSFREAHPGVRTLSFVVPAEVIATMLDRGQAGLGIAMNDQPLPAIDTEVIARSELVCVMPATHELAKRDAVSMAELEGETIISYRGASLPGMLLERALAREGARLRPDIEIDVSIIALAFVQQGLGVALVDGLIPWESFPGLAARAFLPTVSLPLCLLTSTRRPLSRGHDLLRAELRRAVREHPASPTIQGVLKPV
ncbi:DNA-binding transcriptional regulator, LysR family [Rhizobiales bacterium GAS191]|nr:DNA-binding transcriptional regulator, LysR family [Rhizobiales bacterium GAS191]